VLPDARLTVAITFRDSDIATDHPIVALLADARRTHGMHELRLAGLDDAEVLELVGESLIETVRARAGGNPFFVTELARHLRDGIVPDLPAVEDVVLRRVRRLSPSTVDVLRMAAAYGQRFPVRVIAHALSRPILDVADCLDQAVAARLAEALPTGELAYGFPHALVRDALYGSLGTAERLRSHLAIATALSDTCPDPGRVATELAHHWYLAAPAGYVAEAVVACRRAARSARAGLGLDEAIAQLQRALDLVTADPTQPVRLRAELLVDLARANGDAGRATALVGWATEASRVASSAEGLDDVVVASALVIRAGMTLTALASDQRTHSLLRAGLERTAPGSDEHLMLRAKHMTTNFYGYDVDTLATIADELLDGAVASGQRHVIRAVAEDVAWYARQQQHHRCVELLHSVVDVADPLSELPYLSQALDELHASGDGQAFRQMFATFAQRAQGDVTYSVAAAFGRATLTLLDGHIERAMREARAARRHGMAERRVAVVAAYIAFALHAAWLENRLPDMQPIVDWAFVDRPHPQIEAWRAWVHATRGDQEPLRSLTTNFTNRHRLMLVSARFTGGSLGALTQAAVLTGDTAALALATELWVEITDAFHGGFFPPDLAVAHYRGMLAQTRGELDDAEAHYRQAIANHEAIGSLPHCMASRRALADLSRHADATTTTSSERFT